MKTRTAVVAVAGGLVLFVAAVAAVLIVAAWAVKPAVPSVAVLEADFDGGLPEAVPDSLPARVMRSGDHSLQGAVEALERAASDKRVGALFVRVGGGMGMARLQELRDAVLAFRKAGKPAVAFAETFGEGGPGNGGYYLASAFDEVWLQPSGDVGLIGLRLESTFIRGTLDKLGVVPRMGQRYEYKNAMNMYTETAMTGPHREAMQAIVDSWFNQIVRGIAAGRKLPESEVRALVDRGPFLGTEAVTARLVDGLSYRDEVLERVKQKAGRKAKTIPFWRYAESAGSPYASGKVIALIHATGGVARGKSSFSPLSGEATMGSDTVAAAFRAAAEDKDVRAIVFRVDSPGGSYVASDTIWREVARARKAGKPVIVTMGDLAGSGGYFVAMGADKIVAQPGTITGSIGVLGGKMLTKGLWDKLGVTFDGVQQGERAGMYDAGRDYSPEEWQRHEDSLDRVYQDFTRKVAEGRKLPLARVQEIARGRIWSGEEAKRLGLVDELGGMPTALRLARQAAGLAPDADVKLVPFPAPRSLFQLLNAGDDAAAVRTEWLDAASTARLASLARALGVGAEPGVLAMGLTPTLE